jgi:hypothetical protein
VHEYVYIHTPFDLLSLTQLAAALMRCVSPATS